MHAHARAYLSVFEWPETFGEGERADALAAAAGMDEHAARSMARQATPVIVAMIDAGSRARVLEGLRGRGVVATAPTHDELDRLPAPILAKRLDEAMGADGRLYMIEPWRGESEGLRTEDVRLLVRASLRLSETHVRRDPNSGYATMDGYLVSGVPGMPAGGLGDLGGVSDRTTRTTFTEVLDIYTADKRRVRVNADKFAFDCLGEDRGYSHKLSLDALTTKLAELAPRAFIDLGFQSFRPPADVRVRAETGSGDATTRTRSDLGAFDFYSPWFAVGYAALLKSPKR